MDDSIHQERETLRAELAKAREKLDALVQNLRRVDAELEALAPERRQHLLLHDACTALEALRESGGAALFWGERVEGAVDQLRPAIGRVEAFQKRWGEIEDRRDAVLEEIDLQRGDTDWLEDEEERRQQEWVMEREISALPARALILPWTRGGEEDRRFRKSLATALACSLLFAVVVPQIPLPLRLAEEEAPDVSERVVRLMMQSRPLPPPALSQAVPLPQRTKPPEEQVAELPPKPAAELAEGPGQGRGEGPGAGPAKGLLAFRERLATLPQNQAVARLGAQARIATPGPASGRVERAMITTLAPGSSGGINLAALSRGVSAGGGGPMAGVQIARATSPIIVESGGVGGGAGSASGTGGGGPLLGRTDEEIQIVFDRHKAALYRLYNRELRTDPTLQGQMVLRIRIEPDGSVSLCELRATDMQAPQLAAQVVDRVHGFDFGAKDVPSITILYPIDFLPAT